MINFSKYKTILWDFDGVLMDSMPVRDRGFELVLHDYPAEHVRQLMVYHRQNGGLSRYVKFRYFFEEIRKEAITEEMMQDLTKKFSEIMRYHLTDTALLIDDSLAFVKRYYSHYNMHIVSGSDGNELNYLCAELGISRYFKSIHGSPTPKTQLVKAVIEHTNISECVLIGDSINDQEAAAANRIDFIGYNNDQLRKISNYYIDRFSDL
jgi:HAD superfamily hydrolase (TIGR01549 family)